MQLTPELREQQRAGGIVQDVSSWSVTFLKALSGGRQAALAV